jgi:hypothetical protein
LIRRVVRDLDCNNADHRNADLLLAQIMLRNQELAKREKLVDHFAGILGADNTEIQVGALCLEAELRGARTVAEIVATVGDDPEPFAQDMASIAGRLDSATRDTGRTLTP